MITDYNAIFQDLESSLISLGSKNAPLKTIRRNLDQFKHFEGNRSCGSSNARPQHNPSDRPFTRR